MSTSEPCELLEWDSKFFARRIARVSAGVLTPEVLAAVERQTAREHVECLYLLADTNQPETIRLAQASGFRLVDIRVTLDARLSLAQASGLLSPARERASTADDPSFLRSRAPESASTRIGTSADVSTLRAIAKASHGDSRFYQDGGFPRERCDALYEAWIENSFQGWAEVVFVSEVNAEPVAYVTCTRNGDGLGQIGLMGVDLRMHGLGHGTRLVQRALDWFRRLGCSRATVVTQGRNIAAQRLYQKCGFATCQTQLWFHRWFAPPRD